MDVGNKNSDFFRIVFRIQLLVSALFIGISALCPIYILLVHGLGAANVLDRSGKVIGSVNLFLFSIAFSIFIFLVSRSSYRRAQDALRKMGSEKEHAQVNEPTKGDGGN